MEPIPLSQLFQLKSLMCTTFHLQVTLSLISQLPERSRTQNLSHSKDIISTHFLPFILVVSPAGTREFDFDCNILSWWSIFHCAFTLSLISQLPEGSRTHNMGHLKALFSALLLQSHSCHEFSWLQIYLTLVAINWVDAQIFIVPSLVLLSELR